MPGPELGLREDTVTGDQVDVLLRNIGSHALGGGGVVAQATLGGFLLPFLAVAVTAEDDPLVVGEGLADQVVKSLVKVLRSFQHIGKLPQLLGHNGVQGNVGAGHRLGGAQHTELELVAGEGQRTGAVPVGGILGDGRHHVHANTHDPFLGVHIIGAVDDGPDNGAELVTQEDGYNGRGSLVTAQAVVIAGGGGGAAQEVLIFIHTLDEGCQEHQELGILGRRLAGLEQVPAGVGA